MKLKALVVAALALFSLMPVSAAGQDAETTGPVVTHELRLRDGSRVYGRISQESDTEIIFETASGVMITARRDQILRLRKVEGRMRNGEFQPADPNNTRLLYGPTGRSLPRGQTYLAVHELIMPSIQVGVTDRFSIGGGTPLIFGFEGDGFDRPFWITPKLQIFNGRTAQVSVGAFQGFGGGASAGIAYGVGTVGGSEGSVTGGAGIAYNSDGGRTFVAMVGGDRPMRRNIKFVTENYVWGSGDGIISAGIRFYGDRLSADFALFSPIGAGETYVFPLLNFVYLF